MEVGDQVTIEQESGMASNKREKGRQSDRRYVVLNCLEL